MGRPKAFSLKQTAIRLVEEPPLYADYSITKPMDAVQLLSDVLKNYDREVIAVVNLQSDSRPINMSIVSMGTLNAALASPRDIMKCAILSNAASILLVHNHVSGSLTPSKQDIIITDRLHKVCEMLDIPVCDHIIIGKGQQYFSFREKRVMPIEQPSYATSIEEIELQTKVAESSTKESVLGKLQENKVKQAKNSEGRKPSRKALE